MRYPSTADIATCFPPSPADPTQTPNRASDVLRQFARALGRQAAREAFTHYLAAITAQAGECMA